MKDVGCRGIVDDDAGFHFTTELRQVLPKKYHQCLVHGVKDTEKMYLDVIALVVITAFPEQAMSYHAVHVEYIQYGIGVLLTIITTLTLRLGQGYSL